MSAYFANQFDEEHVPERSYDSPRAHATHRPPYVSECASNGLAAVPAKLSWVPSWTWYKINHGNRSS
eukprot:1379878-Amorphochlora_amoeboformis.AAC.1